MTTQEGRLPVSRSEAVFNEFITSVARTGDENVFEKFQKRRTLFDRVRNKLSRDKFSNDELFDLGRRCIDLASSDQDPLPRKSAVFLFGVVVSFPNVDFMALHQKSLEALRGQRNNPDRNSVIALLEISADILNNISDDQPGGHEALLQIQEIANTLYVENRFPNGWRNVRRGITQLGTSFSPQIYEHRQKTLIERLGRERRPANQELEEYEYAAEVKMLHNLGFGIGYIQAKLGLERIPLIRFLKTLKEAEKDQGH